MAGRSRRGHSGGSTTSEPGAREPVTRQAASLGDQLGGVGDLTTPPDRRISMEYAVIDVETTGLYHGGHDRIVEVAIFRLAPDGSVVDQFETLLNPERDMGPTWLHGIETRDVIDAPVFLDVSGDVVRLMRDAVAIGHNIGFDLRFLRQEFARVGFAIPYQPYIDTLSLALRMGATSRGLEDACTLFGIPLTDSHSAFGDASATAALFARGAQHLGSAEIGRLMVTPADSGTNSWPSPASRPGSRRRPVLVSALLEWPRPWRYLQNALCSEGL